MKNDTLYATVALTCGTCRTQAEKENVVLYSEKTGHFHCAQCGYKILEVIFRFEKTNLGISVEKRPVWQEFYGPVFMLYSFNALTVTFKTGTGKITITIDGNQ